MKIRFEERLCGSYRRPENRDQPLRLELFAESIQGLRFDATGSITARGIAREAELRGTIAYARPWSIAYDLRFAGEDGTGYRLVANKSDLDTDVYAGFTMLRGHLLDEKRSARIASVGARFDARGDLTWWLRHLKLSRS